nr:MAG: hypothetical protein [Lake Baikal virophage 14]
MNSKEINQLIKFREKYGHYPHVYHRALIGGGVGDDIKNFFTNTIPGGFRDAADAIAHGFDEFGNDLKTGFGVVGNFIVKNKSIFISAIVTTGLMLLFPEFAPEIAMMGVQELLPKIMDAMPSQATGTPTQDDIDKAIAAYKADPRYQAMMDRCSNFIKNFSQYAKYEAPLSFTGKTGVGVITNPLYYWTRPTSITMGTNNGDIVLYYQDSNGNNKCSPIQICLKTGGEQLMNYIVPIKNQDNPPAILNADGSNYKELLAYMNYKLSEEQQSIQDNQNQHIKEARDAAKAVDDKVTADAQYNQSLKEWNEYIASLGTPSVPANRTPWKRNK